MGVNYNILKHVMAAGAMAIAASPAYADPEFRKSNIAENARILAPIVLESKFKARRLGGDVYMDPIRLKKRWADNHDGVHPALSLYDTAPFGKINEGDILSIIIYDGKRVSGRAMMDAQTGKIIWVDEISVDYGKVLDDILQEKMRLDSDS